MMDAPDAVRWRGLAVALIAAFAAVAVAGVFLRPLIPIDETRYVDVAWEMRLRGSWFLPLKNFELYTDKPPMLFWLINLAWTISGGVSGFAARIVGPAFAVIALVGTWALGRRLWDDATGAVAAVVLAGLSVFAIYGGATMFDTMLIVATLAGLRALIAALETPGMRRSAWIALGLALAFGVLAKGPVILVHVLPVLLAAPLWTEAGVRPGWRDILRGVGLALAVALGVVALWVVPAAITGGAEYRHMILWEQTAGRTVQSFAHARPWYWLLALMPAILFPWIWSPSFWTGLRGLTLADRGLRLCLVQAGVGIFLFSLISGKQVHYLMPEMPAIALIIARTLLASGHAAQPGRLAHLPLAAVLLLVGIAPLAAALGAADAHTAALLHPLLAPFTFALYCIVLAALAMVLPRLAGLATAGLGLVAGFLALIATTGLGPGYDSAPIARAMAAHEAAGLAVVTDRYNAEFGFEGRLTQPVTVLAGAQAADWLAAHPGGLLAGECAAVPLDPATAEHHAFYGADWCLWQAP